MWFQFYLYLFYFLIAIRVVLLMVVYANNFWRTWKVVHKKNLHVFFSRKFVGCVTSGTFKKKRFAIEFFLGYVDHIHCFIPLKYDTILTVELSNHNEVGFKPCKLLINFFSTIVICCIIPDKHKVDLVLYCGENLIEIDYPRRHIQYIMAMKKYIIVWAISHKHETTNLKWAFFILREKTEAIYFWKCCTRILNPRKKARNILLLQENSKFIK